MRFGWDGNYFEELSMDERSVDLSRLQSGAPLLNSHQSHDLNSVIGVVERAWIDGNEGKAIVRFSSDPEADKIYQKVKEKVLRNVSVGYMVRKYENVTQKGDEIPTYRATNWQPHEISIVPIGFDPQAQVRENEENNEVEIETPNTEADSITSTTVEPQADLTIKEPDMTDAEKRALELAAKKQAAQEEKQRQSDIRLAVRSAKLDEKFADELIEKDVTADQARAMVLEKLAAEQPASPVTTVRVEVGTDEKEKKREAIENALLNRIDSNVELTSGRDFRGMTLIRVAEELLGGRKGLTDVEIAKRAMTSSDFPLILANIAEKSLASRYSTAPETFSKWTRKSKLRNYKQHSQMRIGDFPSLSERGEEGEFTYGQVGESKEVVQLKKYGKILAFSEELLIGDDLSALGDFISQAGVAAKRLESQLVYNVLMNNPNMNDGNPLFHADHANLGTNGDISETTMDELNQKLKAQKTIDATDYLDIFAKYIICGPSMEVKVRKFLSSIVASQSSNVNVFSGSVEPIVENRITDDRWIITADPAQYDTVTLFHLEGQEAPRVSTRNKWESGAFEIKVEHAAAAAPMDYRGMAANLNP